MSKCVLVTGAAKRIGAAIVRGLHAAGYRVIIHFRESSDAAISLQHELNDLRPRSAELLQADLSDFEHFRELANRAIATFGRIDALINNASAFYATPVDSVTEAQWEEVIGCNLKAPFFLSLAFARELEQRGGAIVNIADIHGLRPLKGFSIYSISKAGMIAMTQSLARELGPPVRVNGLAPGAILWPENEITAVEREQILARIALQRTGMPRDIAEAVRFLLDSDYITGQVLAVDGGRGLYS
ncbi:MAG: pteridine reductase [Methylococcales bacterium]